METDTYDAAQSIFRGSFDLLDITFLIILLFLLLVSALISGSEVAYFSLTPAQLDKLKEKGYTMAALTDLPSAMPDEIFRRDISELLGYFDYYVSSIVAGYRKPNCKGLQMISEKFAFPITKLIFIGDEEKDRRTAMNANCKFIWIQRIEKNKESIDNLNQLLQVLE